MSLLAPPPSPPQAVTGDNDGLRRVRLRLFQILLSAITVFLTAWCCTLGALPAIISLLIAKHVLVAILLMGMGLDDVRDRSRSAPPQDREAGL